MSRSRRKRHYRRRKHQVTIREMNHDASALVLWPAGRGLRKDMLRRATALVTLTVAPSARVDLTDPAEYEIRLGAYRWLV